MTLGELLNKALQIESQSTKTCHQSKNIPSLGPSKGDANLKKGEKNKQKITKNDKE